MRLCILLLLFLFSSFISSAQTPHTFENHQMLDIGNNTKVEILKSRGEGIAEECDVIYFTTKRQEGKRMWQSVRQLKEEERAGRIAREAANPSLKKTTATNLSNNVNTSNEALKNIAKVAFIPPGPTLKEQIRKADSAAKIRAKEIDRQLLATIEKEDTTETDSSIVSTPKKAWEKDNQEVITPPEKYISPLLKSTDQKPTEPELTNTSKPLSDKVITQIVAPPTEIESDSETFVKNYALPTKTSTTTSVVTKHTTQPIQQNTIENSETKKIPIETKAPIADGEINFAKSEIHYAPISTKSMLTIQVDTGQIQLIRPKEKIVLIAPIAYIGKRDVVTTPDYLDIKINASNISIVQNKKTVTPIVKNESAEINYTNEKINRKNELKTKPVFYIRMDISKVRIVDTNTTDEIANNRNEENPITKPIIENSVFYIKVDIRNVKIVSSKPQHPILPVAAKRQDYTLLSVIKQPIFNLNIDFSSIKRISFSPKFITDSIKKDIVTYTTLPLVSKSNIEVKVDNNNVKIIAPISPVVKTEKPLATYSTIPIVQQGRFTVIQDDCTILSLTKKAKEIQSPIKVIIPTYATSFIDTKPYFKLLIHSERVKVIVAKPLATSLNQSSVLPVNKDTSSPTIAKTRNNKKENIEEKSINQAEINSENLSLLVNADVHQNDFLNIIEINKDGGLTKAIIIDKENENRYKVHYTGSKNEDDKWVSAESISEIDSINNPHYFLQKTQTVQFQKNSRLQCNPSTLPPIGEVDTILNEKLIANKIFTLQTTENKLGKTNLSLSFLYMQINTPYLNSLAIDNKEMNLKSTLVPPDVQIYSIKAKYKICKLEAGKTHVIVEDGKYSFFKNIEGKWECKKEE